MSPILMRAVVESVVFIGLSGDDVIQPGAAVSHLEDLGAILRGLSAEEIAAFDTYVAALAGAELASAGPTERVEFLQSLVGDLGLR